MWPTPEESVLATAAREFATETAGRGISDSMLMALNGDSVPLHRPTLTPRGELEEDDASWTAVFSDDRETHQLRIIFDSSVSRANGVSVSYALEGWERLGYVAIGFTDGDAFRHVKVKHVRQDRWNRLTFSLMDLAYQVQNDFDPVPPGAITDARLYLKGRCGPEGGRIRVSWAAAFQAGMTPAMDASTWSVDDAVLAVVERYVRLGAPNTLTKGADAFLSEGLYAVHPDVVLDWPVDLAQPAAIAGNGSYSYMWHSLYPAARLMLHAVDTDSRAAHHGAVRQVTDWIARSYLTPDADRQYTWYDHGVAERFLALIVIRCRLDPDNSDLRTRMQLDHIIARHGLLLECESFYVRNQRDRYHNHGVFQDAALLVGAHFAPRDVARRWSATAVERLKDQLEGLISIENGYGVLVENSSGYHEAIQRLVTLVAEVLGAVTTDQTVASALDAMSRWSEKFRYANYRRPATGDTFRESNLRPRVHAARQTEDVLAMPRAGYALVQGNHQEVAYTLCVFATSLSVTHKHEDHLSLTLNWAGVEWLIDPSFYSHDYLAPVPKYLRSAQAHNCVEILDEEYHLTPGLASLEVSRAGSSEYVVTGRHAAYRDFSVGREIVGRTDRLDLSVTDTVEGPADHPCVLTLHLGEGVDIQVDGALVKLSHPAVDVGLEIRLPASPTAVSGWNASARESSVAGTGIGQYETTTSLRVPLAAPFVATWHIKAAPDSRPPHSRTQTAGGPVVVERPGAPGSS